MGLNQHLCENLHRVWSFDDALAVAWEHMDLLIAAGYAPLDDGEIYRRVGEFWRDAEREKLERWKGQRAHSTSDADEVRYLVSLGRNGADAYALLMLLRAEHGARHDRNETFVISANAMSRARVFGDWSPSRYRDAAALLEKHGFIECVRCNARSAA